MKAFFVFSFLLSMFSYANEEFNISSSITNGKCCSSEIIAEDNSSFNL